MKYILALLFIATTACSLSKESNRRVQSDKIIPYYVYKIDSINAYYLIYARRMDSVYKIVSRKGRIIAPDRIEISKKYRFDLRPTIFGEQVAGKKVLPQNSLLVNCFSYDDSTQICLEGDSIRELYHAVNVQGLYFIKRR